MYIFTHSMLAYSTYVIVLLLVRFALHNNFFVVTHCDQNTRGN